ncbi:MAG TPA: hypothetical protein VGI70_08840, partial [Polyangiales bacterium]
DDHVDRVQVRGPSAGSLDGLVGDKIWAAWGPKLSTRERGRRALLAQQELARAKVTAREHEAQRQVAVARQHEEERVERLRQAHDLAVKKQASYLAERAHQKQLVQDRIARDASEQQASEEAHRRQEMRRLAQAQAAEAPAQPIAYARAQPMSRENTNQDQAWNARSEPAPNAQVSSSTQRWLQSQGMSAPPAVQTVAPEQPIPAQAYVPAAPPPVPSAPVDSSGISPATQRWLAQQRMH